VFESASKRYPEGYKALSVHEIKQIAGRAGRYRVASSATAQKQKSEMAGLTPAGATEAPGQAAAVTNLGLVTALEDMDHKVIRRAMGEEAPPITSAGLFALDSLILRFAAYFPPRTPLSYVLTRLHQIAMVHPLFHLCSLRDHIATAECLHSVPEMMLSDRLVFCAAPAPVRELHGEEITAAFAKCVVNQSGGGLLDIAELRLELLDTPDDKLLDSLIELESLNKALVLYLWLSYRFSGVFTSQAMAFYVKRLVQEKIHKALTTFAQDAGARGRLRKLRESAILREFAQQIEREKAAPELSTTRTSSIQGGECVSGDGSDTGPEVMLDEPASSPGTLMEASISAELDDSPPNDDEVVDEEVLPGGKDCLATSEPRHSLHGDAAMDVSKPQKAFHSS
jgi:ATP-dependent RNA helicase SUPV3L1/SUV3